MNLDTDALIAAIVRGVVEQLGHASPAERTTAPLALVLAPADEKLACEVEKRLQGTMRVRFDGKALDETPELYIVPELSCSDMAELATGRASSLALRQVLELLLQGKAVRTLGFAFRAHADTAPCALLRLYEGYAATLAQYGLTELPPMERQDAVLRALLVTAEHVAAAAADGARVLRVPHGALVTPLAQEAAAEHNVTILKNM